MLEPGGREPQLAQGARLELADALARDAELRADLFERLRRLAVEAEAEREHPAHARVQLIERPGKLPRARLLGRLLVRREGMDVFDQVAVEALAVAHRRLEADRGLDELQE